MKTPWAQALAWIAAVVAAGLFAWASPDEGNIEQMSSPHMEMLFRDSR